MLSPNPLLKSKTCLVIGGGSIAPGWGIGRAISFAYAREGARVAVADLNLESAQETADLIRNDGGDARAFAVDVTDDSSIVAMVRKVESDLGPVDVLHNNVGRSNEGSVAIGAWRSG